jgi:hypothetical protein
MSERNSIGRVKAGVVFAGAMAAALVAGGCVQMPVGPSIAVMPAPNKPFEVFANEDAACRDWAARSIGAMDSDAPAQAFVGSTVAGAALGAAVGGLAGGRDGAAAGAAFGTVVGAATGANRSAWAGQGAQRRYDIAYAQCMYAKGNPVAGPYYARRPAGVWGPPAPRSAYPPPPPEPPAR